jgi:hypothetical protein
MTTAPAPELAVPEGPVGGQALRVLLGLLGQRAGVAPVAERAVPRAGVALAVQRALPVQRAQRAQRVRRVALMEE